jgi:hypothetical protein
MVAIVLMPPRATAQRIAPSGVVSRVARAAGATPADSGRTGVFDGERAISGGILGTLAGTAVGALGAYAVTHRDPGADHMMDGAAYLYLVPIGAAVGLLVGTIVGGFTHD